MHVDLVIHNAGQLVTCASPSGPKRGPALRDVGLIENGAIAISDGEIVAIGLSRDVRAEYAARQTIDAGGNVVCPGFVGPHTHVAYAGNRIDEFELRVKGATYQDIMAAGGGIVSTMQSVRVATPEQIINETRVRLDQMLALGTTTVEAKSGYGLDTANELKLLGVVEALDQAHAIDLVPTFMGAHAIPPEYRNRGDDYVALVVEQMTPAIAAWYRATHFAARGVPLFADVFCERNAFDVEQSRRVLAAAKSHGMRIKAHVDEFSAMGGVAMALGLDACSVDHLDVTGSEDMRRIAQSDTIAVIIPAVTVNLGGTHFADARGLIDAGAALALTTDINPGSAPCPSLPLVMAIACRYQHLAPAEALNAVTINAAHAIGLGQHAGSLEAGKQADVLIVDAPDYRHLAYQFGANLVRTVVKRGRVLRGRVIHE